jgi:hypothetical protein
MDAWDRCPLSRSSTPLDTIPSRSTIHRPDLAVSK